MIVVGLGEAVHLSKMSGDIGAGLTDIFNCGGQNRNWISETPFVAPPFHQMPWKEYAGEPGERGAGFSQPAGSRGERIPSDHEISRRLRHFVYKRRSKANQPPADYIYALKLHFDEPVQGPICLGYASHFGLGLFRSER